MTATELYEIVKDHRDVWGEVLAFCDYNDASHWASRIHRRDYTIQCSNHTAEAALLGLGVKWLASGGGSGHAFITGLIVRTNGHTDIDVWSASIGDENEMRTNILAAVYAAIAKVKHNEASKP